MQGHNPTQNKNLDCMPSVLDIWGLLPRFWEFLELLVEMKAK